MGSYPIGRPSDALDVPLAAHYGAARARRLPLARWLLAAIGDIVTAGREIHVRFRRSSKRAGSAPEEQQSPLADPPEQAAPLAPTPDAGEPEPEHEPLPPPVVEYTALDTPLRVVRQLDDVVHAADADPGEAAPTPPPPIPASGLAGEEEHDMLGVPLGTLVFRAGLLTFEQGEDALREATSSGRRLGQVLLERGWIDERQLARFLAGQKGLEFVDLDSAAVDPEAAARLSEDSARVYRALPISSAGGAVLVAIADPTNESAMGQIRALFGGDVVFGVAASDELDRAISAAFNEGAGAAAFLQQDEAEPAWAPPPGWDATPATPPAPDAQDAPADERLDEAFDTPFTREESRMEAPGNPEPPPQWPRPDESFGSFGREEPQPAGAMPGFAATEPAQQYAAPQPDASPGGGFGMTGSDVPSQSVAVRLVLRLGQTDALELGSFDDAARATAFAMTLRPFLRQGTIVSVDIAEA